MAEAFETAIEAPVYPTIAFDIRLGKSVGFIDFDYDGYYEHLSSAGMSDEQIAASQIKIIPNNYINPRRGYVNANTGDLTVMASNSVNKYFRHETQHLIDYHNSPFTSGEKRYIKAHTVGMYCVTPILVGESLASEYVFHQPEAVSNGLWVAATGVLALSSLAYYCSKTERRARQAEKATQKQFIEIRKRP